MQKVETSTGGRENRLEGCWRSLSRPSNKSQRSYVGKIPSAWQAQPCRKLIDATSTKSACSTVRCLISDEKCFWNVFKAKFWSNLNFFSLRFGSRTSAQKWKRSKRSSWRKAQSQKTRNRKRSRRTRARCRWRLRTKTRVSWEIRIQSLDPFFVLTLPSDCCEPFNIKDYLCLVILIRNFKGSHSWRHRKT